MQTSSLLPLDEYSLTAGPVRGLSVRKHLTRPTRIILLALICAGATGCQDSRTSAELWTLRSQVRQLSAQVARADQQLARLEARPPGSERENNMNVREEPSRDALLANDPTACLPPVLAWMEEVSQRLQSLEREAARLRELTAQQATSLSGAQQAAVVKTTLSQVRQDVAELDKGIDRRIDSRVRRMESNVSKLNDDVQTLQSRLRLR